MKLEPTGAATPLLQVAGDVTGGARTEAVVELESGPTSFPPSQNEPDLKPAQHTDQSNHHEAE